MTADEAKLEPQAADADRRLTGLGGWLVLVGIGVVSGPPVMGWTLYTYYSELFADPSFFDTFDPASPAYAPSIVALLYGEGLANSAIFLASIVSVYGFFARKRWFPNLYIAILVGSWVFMCAGAVAAYQIAGPQEDGSFTDAETMRSIVKSLIASLIWVPYMLVSRRVKLTFTR